MTIRISNKTLAAIDMISGKMRAMTGEKITQDEVIWKLIESAEPEIAKNVKTLSKEDEPPTPSQN